VHRGKGREFRSGLTQREQRNPQFDFLKPTHLVFAYFTSLVDAYTKVLHPDETLRPLVEDRGHTQSALVLAVERWAWTRAEEERKSREANEERSAVLLVDWFDFVVVETIQFAEDEVFSAPLAWDFGALPLYGRSQKSSSRLWRHL
jgi:splicing factor 3A subunit 1